MVRELARRSQGSEKGYKTIADPILTQSIIKNGKKVFQATVSRRGTVTFIKKVKLTPDELENVTKLKRQMTKTNPSCHPDVSKKWAKSYLTLHDEVDDDYDSTFPTYGSCKCDTVDPYYKLNNILEEKFNDDLWKDNKYN